MLLQKLLLESLNSLSSSCVNSSSGSFLYFFRSTSFNSLVSNNFAEGLLSLSLFAASSLSSSFALTTASAFAASCFNNYRIFSSSLFGSCLVTASNCHSSDSGDEKHFLHNRTIFKTIVK